MKQGYPGTIVINATCIGRTPDGLAVYTRHIVTNLVQSKIKTRFIIYINQKGLKHLSHLNTRPQVTLRIVTGKMAPENGFRGHLFRWIFSQIIGMFYPRTLIFNPSQLEIALFHRYQIVTIHDTLPLDYPEYHSKQFFFYRKILPIALKHSPEVITPSRYTLKQLSRRYRLTKYNIHVIHHGLSVPVLKSKDLRSDGGQYILYIGRLSPTKNLPGLITAFRYISNRIPHRLMIAGAGDPTKLENNLSMVKDRIQFIGYISQEYKIELLHRADVFVFPSFGEGFGFPPLEAMACGCPVVVSKRGALPEICGSAAVYVDPNEPTSIAEGILRVIKNQKFRSDLIRRGFLQVQKFQWSLSTKQHLEVFSKMGNHELKSLQVPY